jgi:hypothetical protein
MIEVLTVIGASFSLTWEGTALGIALITGLLAGLFKISRAVQDIRNRVDAVGPDGHVVLGLVEGQARIEGKVDAVLQLVEKATHTLMHHTEQDADNFGTIEQSLSELAVEVGNIKKRDG